MYNYRLSFLKNIKLNNNDKSQSEILSAKKIC